MNPALLFGATKLNVDPETMNTITVITIFIFGAAILGFFGLMIWHFAPILYSKRKQSKETANAIWLDSFESEIHYGHRKMRIEPKSFEYYVCQVVFSVPNKYHKDLDVFDKADEAKGIRETRRGVEQAVRRLNKKFRELGLKDDLFKRSKERTTINNQYHQNIIKN
jgi:hypothetical protein